MRVDVLCDDERGCVMCYGMMGGDVLWDNGRVCVM